MVSHIINKRRYEKRGKQDERKSRDVIKGEELVVIAGSIPAKIDDKEIRDKVKYSILKKAVSLSWNGFFCMQIENEPT